MTKLYHKINPTSCSASSLFVQTYTQPALFFLTFSIQSLLRYFLHRNKVEYMAYLLSAWTCCCQLWKKICSQILCQILLDVTFITTFYKQLDWPWVLISKLVRTNSCWIPIQNLRYNYIRIIIDSGNFCPN